MMDWFESITGFRELAYPETQAKLWVEDGRLCSKHSANRYAVGKLETPTLAELRGYVANGHLREGCRRTRVSLITGDARKLHSEPAFRGSLFQVASQFNLLEMVGPSVTPEHGVAGYANDRTQGPACAIAAGAGTIFRNYLVPLDGHLGQTHSRQIDCLAEVGNALGNPTDCLWTMRNGYALCTEQGLQQIDRRLEVMTQNEYDGVRALLRIGLHWNVQVTDVGGAEQLVSQAYCSALPVAYSQVPRGRWCRFASLVLEGAYEATLLAGMLNAQRGGNNIVLLTRLGGGAFGNEPDWINNAIARAIRLTRHSDLDIRIVCYGNITPDLQELVSEFVD
jgi:hypothetical protein